MVMSRSMVPTAVTGKGVGVGDAVGLGVEVAGTGVLGSTGVAVGIAVAVGGRGVFVGVGTSLNSTFDGASRSVIGVGEGVSEKNWSKALEKGVPTAWGSVPNPVIVGSGVDVVVLGPVTITGTVAVGVKVWGTTVKVGSGVTLTGPAQAAAPIRKGTIAQSRRFIQVVPLSSHGE